MSGASTAQIVEVVPNRLFGLGATVPNDGRIHWVPADAAVEIPLNSFLLIEGRSAAVIDTSYPVIEKAIANQLDAFSIDDAVLVMTRAVEFDSMANAEIIVEKLPVYEVWSQFAAYEWVYMRNRGDVPMPPQFGSVRFDRETDLVIGGTRRLTIVPAKLRLLATAWVYDHATKTLFTSDLFAHVMSPAPGVRMVTDTTDTTERSWVERYLLTKFDWLAGARTAPLIDFVNDVFARFDVETIAPTTGCIIQGRRLVERHKMFLLDTLHGLAT